LILRSPNEGQSTNATYTYIAVSFNEKTRIVRFPRKALLKQIKTSSRTEKTGTSARRRKLHNLPDKLFGIKNMSVKRRNSIEMLLETV
jgi:hypothetical protein